ncbi:MAG TPA: hypothetical protein VFB58_12855 [Chloroflexota bacterium]|nr:hypothetical protein [Chloroflexota bacterium]
MEGRSLQEIVDDAVQRAGSAGSTDEEALYHQVLQDQDIRLILDGYRMHDRGEGLEDVIRRAIRHMVDEAARGGESR